LLLPALIIQPREGLRAAGALLLVAAPWHIAQTLRHGADFWTGYLGHHVAARMTSAVVPSLTRSEQLQLLAGEPVLLALAVIGVGAASVQGFKQPATRFALCWLGLSVLPLVVSKTVLPHYLLPLIPGLVLLSTQALSLSWFQQRVGLLLSAALVLISVFSGHEKLSLWLDPDFSPDEKAAGQRLAQLAKPDDLVASYNLMNNSLVFYSGGLPISIYSDDAQFIAIQHAVLMMQRQAGRAGGVVELTGTKWPPLAAGHHFIVTHSGSDSDRLQQLLHNAAPERPWFRRKLGALSLINDASEGDSITH
jgi:4-amino-4-deoxy-L-arabinose transferase-like glycosyltransferase